MSDEEIRQMNMARLKIYHELGSAAVWERYKILPQISALAATLLVVATFNEKVIILTNQVRILLIILLLLIPVSLIGYLVVLHSTEKHAMRNIKKIGDGLPTEQMKQDFFTAYLPWLIVGIISIAIFLIVFLVAEGFCS